MADTKKPKSEKKAPDTTKLVNPNTYNTEPLKDPLHSIADTLGKGLEVKSREKRGKTEDQPLWVAIRECVEGRGFEKYDEFLRDILFYECSDDVSKRLQKDQRISKAVIEPCLYQHGVHGYELLKLGTEVFLLCHSCCGELSINFPDDPIEKEKRISKEARRLGYLPDSDKLADDLTSYLISRNGSIILPYIDVIVKKLMDEPKATMFFPFCDNNIRVNPCLFELIWSYWHEEGMLTQTLGAIALRFQNRHVGQPGSNPLANFEINPLRPVSNFLWGYIADTERRLTVKRRAYEYEHEYGLKLVGKAVGTLQPADRRSKFLHAFHNLLNECSSFYKDDSNHWITPDTFPMLQAIKEVHLLLAEGAHNQWGDLPSTARVEMMIEQWLLAQPPMREFLHSRAMVPYYEEWMGQVDAMKGLMNWTDVSIMHFHKLAVFGEMILLSLRFGNWNDINLSSSNARNWALYWKDEIQSYIESYRAVTGVDLSATATVSRKIDAIMPSTHLKRRLAQQQKRKKTMQAQ